MYKQTIRPVISDGTRKGTCLVGFLPQMLPAFAMVQMLDTSPLYLFRQTVDMESSYFSKPYRSVGRFR